MIETIRLKIPVTGSNGSAVGSGYAPLIQGLLLEVYVEYAASSAATTDVTITTEGINSPALALLTLTNNNTSGRYRPSSVLHDSSGVAVEDRSFPVINDRISVAVAQADNNKDVTVYFTITK